MYSPAFLLSLSNVCLFLDFHHNISRLIVPYSLTDSEQWKSSMVFGIKKEVSRKKRSAREGGKLKLGVYVVCTSLTIECSTCKFVTWLGIAG